MPRTNAPDLPFCKSAAKILLFGQVLAEKVHKRFLTYIFIASADTIADFVGSTPLNAGHGLHVGSNMWPLAIHLVIIKKTEDVISRLLDVKL